MNPKEHLTPLAPRFMRSDSLKNASPDDIDLLKQSYQIQPSKEISYLNNKIGSLQNKIKSIKTQQAEPKYEYNKENIDINNLSMGEEKQKYMVGRFHKRNSVKYTQNATNLINTGLSLNPAVRNNRSLSHNSRVSGYLSTNKSQIIEKETEIKNMRKQMLKLRMKIQKSQRSMSKCSQKLSQSRQNIKNLQGAKKTNERLIANLMKDLKKSDNIRKKQKQTIAKQKKQIQELKNLVNILKANIRV